MSTLLGLAVLVATFRRRHVRGRGSDRPALLVSGISASIKILLSDGEKRTQELRISG